MSKIITFGEIMMRLQPEGFKRFFQAEKYEICFGGGEANVAASLAGFGADAAFLTKLPENELGGACLSDLKKRGIETRFILRGGERLGLYFCEKGASQRPSRIIYDRKNSSINEIDADEIDAEKLFCGAEWFHFSGITAALSDRVLNVLKFLLKEAKKRGVIISCDLNYRKKLWSIARAGEVMAELTGLSDVLISNEEECKDVFGLTACGADIKGGVVGADSYAALSEVVMKKFENLRAAAFTLRGSVSASVNRWGGILTVRKGGADGLFGGFEPKENEKFGGGRLKDAGGSELKSVEKTRGECFGNAGGSELKNTEPNAYCTSNGYAEYEKLKNAAEFNCFRSKEYTVNIVDRVGAGDSFTAGLIYSALNKKSPEYAVEFAAAASCLKHTVEGDFNIASVEEVETLMNGDGSGRVRR
ncbi:MAG: sugar kinase [Clostridiales bacterium]|jgi:2-dehydro-3-deoxygluconokinase|nr:sugar kinase [Clostridiales bacterium]